jgi:hypothetical protein
LVRPKGPKDRSMAFPVESIPDHDRLFCHVPNKPQDFWVVEQNRPSSAAFKGKKDRSDERFRASVDWEKYKTIQEARRPKSMAIVAVTPAQCKPVGKNVEHTPICNEELVNQAHSDICDPLGRAMTNRQNTEASSRLAEAAVIVWPEDGQVSFGA